MVLNRYNLLKDYIDRNVKCSGFPNKVYIEITNKCNFNCIMCPRKNMLRKQGFMDIELFKNIIDQLVIQDVELVYLYLAGEPLLHPDIYEIIKYTKSSGLKINLSTNGSVLNHKIGNWIISNKVDFLVISIDTITPEMFKKIKGKDLFQKVFNNVQCFLINKGLKKHPFTVIQMIEMDENKNEAEFFRRFWQNKFNVNVKIKPAHDWTGSVSVKRNNNGELKLCDRLWKQMVILWDGSVVPCCYHYDRINVLGNANDDSLINIWNNDNYQDFRETHIEFGRNYYPLCATCKYRCMNNLEKIGFVLKDAYSIEKYIYSNNSKIGFDY